MPTPPRKPSVTFFCPHCRKTEEIPTEVVLHFDFLDEGDPSFPPRFLCPFGCAVYMTPVHYTALSGFSYQTDLKTGRCRSCPPSAT